jgi:hypothetical protein
MYPGADASRTTNITIRNSAPMSNKSSRHSGHDMKEQYSISYSRIVSKDYGHTTFRTVYRFYTLPEYVSMECGRVPAISSKKKLNS